MSTALQDTSSELSSILAAGDNVSRFSWNDTRFQINETDRIINQENDSTVLNNLMMVVSVLLVGTVNVYVLFWIKKKNRTLVDSMILLDCVANIGGLLGQFFGYPKQLWVNVPFCRFALIFRWFFLILNRVIPVTIAIYRYILVCQGMVSQV